MRKNLVSMAVLLAFLLAMLPSVALADDTAPVSDAQIHNVSALKSYCNTSDLSNSFYYGGMRSHIIGYDGEGILNAPGQVTLFTWYIYGKTQFGPNVNYADSYLKTRMDDLADSKLSEIERGAIAPRTLTSKDEISGADVADALLWPLSKTEAEALDYSKRIYNSGDDWWSRTRDASVVIESI